MERFTVLNFVETDGETVRLEELSDERKREFSETIQDNMMSAVGYRRKQGGDTKAV